MNKLYSKVTSIELYKILFMVCSLLYILPKGDVVASILLKGMLVWGFLLLVIRFYQKRIIIDNKFFIFFIIFTLLSIIFNFQDGFIRNIKDFLYLILEVVLLTQVDKGDSKNILIFNRILLGFMTFGYTVSLLIFFFRIPQVPGFEKFIMSYTEGRLWGWCGNPNTLATMSLFGLFAAFFNIYLRKENLSVLNKLGYGFIIIEALACLTLSQSRSGFVGFAVLVFGAVFFIGIYKNKHIIGSILLALIIGIASVFMLEVYGWGLRQMPSEKLAISVNSNGYFSIQEDGSDGGEVNPSSSDMGLENREIGSDYSNGRFTIWKGGLSVAKENILFGVGQNALNDEVNQKLPKDYVKQSPKIAANMHNIYLQVLATSGIFAFIFFVLQFVNSFWKRRKEIFNDALKCMFFVLIGCMLIINLFDSNIIGFMNLFIAGMFWIYFGYFTSECADNKKVLFLINSLKIGGAETVLRDIVNHFDFQNYDITVRTLFSEGELLDEFSSFIHYSTVLKKPNPLNKAILWRCVKYLPSVIIQYFIHGQYDYAIAFLEGMPTKIVGSLKNTDCKKYCWIHTDLVHNFESETNYHNREQALKCYQGMENIICVSNDCKDKFLQIYPELKDRTIVIYNCLDIERIRMLSDEVVESPFLDKKSSILLCSVGRLVKEKGFLRMLHVIERLKKENVNLQWLLIGDGNQKDILKEYVKKHGLEENVAFLGYQKNPFAYMKLADYYVCSSFVEGFSLTVVEALIVGVAVISTQCTGPSEILSDNCGILCENSEDGLYDTLKVINKKKKELPREKIEKRIAQFRVETVLDSIYKLIGGQ